MPRYLVTVGLGHTTLPPLELETITVEADSEESAIEKALGNSDYALWFSAVEDEDDEEDN